MTDNPPEPAAEPPAPAEPAAPVEPPAPAETSAPAESAPPAETSAPAESAPPAEPAPPAPGAPAPGAPAPGAPAPGAPAARSQPAAAPAADKAPRPFAEQQRVSRADIEDELRAMLQAATNAPRNMRNFVMFAGDMHVAAAAEEKLEPPPPRDTAEVDPDEIRKIRRVYRLHAAYPQALTCLQKSRCVVLRGRPGVGKRAAAIRLADDLNKAAPIRELSPDYDLIGQARAFAAQQGMILMVDDLLAAAVREKDKEKGKEKDLSQRGAADLLAELRRQDCYLIICAQPGVPLPANLPAVTLEPISATFTRDLLRDHLDFCGPFPEKQVEAALANPRVAALLDAGLTPGEVSELAEQLAKVFRDDLEGAPDFDRALNGFGAAAERQVAAWFDAPENTRFDRAFRLALAAFHGAHYPAVYEAARRLERALQPPRAADDKPPPAPDPFDRKPRSRLLAEAGAKIVRRRQAKFYSDAAEVETVELDNPGLANALLRYIWVEYDDLRGVVLNWLTGYAVGDELREMRVRAAVAIGTLASVDFYTIQQKVFGWWAHGPFADNDERRRCFDALGRAFYVLAWDDARKDDMLGLLDAWCASGDQTALWAVARAYSQVGLVYPRRAMTVWRAILETQAGIQIRLTENFALVLRHPLHMSVIDAVGSLFLSAAELPHSLRHVYEPALEGLNEWVEADAKEPGSEQIGLPLFLALTAIKLRPEDPAAGLDDAPPAMLYIVGTQPDSSYRRILASLFRRAFRHPALQPQAAEALRGWVAAAESSPWLKQTLAAVLREWLALPGASERERGFLRMYLTRWARLPKAPLPFAGELLYKLQLAGPALPALAPVRKGA